MALPEDTPGPASALSAAWRGEAGLGRGEGAAQGRQPGLGAAAPLSPAGLYGPFSPRGAPAGPGRGRQGRHSPLAVLQADCGSPVWSARGSSFDAVYCAEMAHGKPDPTRRGAAWGQRRPGPAPRAWGGSAARGNAALSPPPPGAGYAAEQSGALSSLDCLSSIVDRLSPAEEPGLSLRDAASLSPSASIDSGPETPGTPLPRRTYQAL